MSRAPRRERLEEEKEEAGGPARASWDARRSPGCQGAGRGAHGSSISEEGGGR